MKKDEIEINSIEMIKSVKILLLFYFLCILGCAGFNRPGFKEYNVVDRTRGANNMASIEKFSSYPIDKQIDMYLIGTCCVEGGGGWTTPYLIRDGEEKIPSIVRRIEVFPDDIRDKAALISALVSINKECQCLKKYPEIIKRLEVVEEKIKAEKIPSDDNYQETYRKLYSDDLAEIKKQS